jgi:hypothetical protein
MTDQIIDIIAAIVSVAAAVWAAAIYLAGIAGF